MILDSPFISGSMSFGIANPSATMHISASTGAVLRVDGGGVTNTGSLFVSSSGNVGIGTAIPVSKLQIEGGALRIGDGAGAWSGFTFSGGLRQTNNNPLTILGELRVDSTAGNPSYISGSGGLGIGKTTANARLDVNGSLLVSGSITSTSTITAQTLVVQTVTSSVSTITGSTQFGSSSINTHQFTGSVLVNGNVGIGTTNPSYRLHVSGAFSTNPGLYVYGTTYGMVGVDRGSSASSAGINYYTTGSQRWFAGIYENTNNFGFYNATTATFPLIITSGNNVGIGTSSPLSILHVSSSSSTITGKVILQSPSSDSGILQIGSTYGEASMMFIPGVTSFGTSSPARTSTYGNVGLWGLGPGTYTSDPTKFGIANVGFGANILTVSSSGNVLIGTTTDNGAKLQVSGSTTTRLGLTIFGAAGGYTTGDNPFLGIGGTGADTFGVINAPFGDKMKLNAYHGFEFKTSNNGASGTPVLKATISTEGYLRLASSGIQFQGATAAANALNYYEEGSWTPALQNATVSYSTRSGTYVRIGNYVFVRWGFLISSISGVSGTVTISGLPFTGVNWGSYQEPNISVSTGVLVTADNAFKARVFVQGSGTSLIGRISNNADTPWETNQLQNGTWIIGEIFYNIA
jgi:hypothetical protein